MNETTSQRTSRLLSMSNAQLIMHAQDLTQQRDELLAALDVIIPALEIRAKGDSYLSSDQFNAVRKCREIKSDVKGGAA